MVRIAAQIQPQHCDYTDIRRAAVQCEERGVDVIYTWDHFFPLFGKPDGKHFECWTLLAAFAEVTERVRFGAMVTCNTYRNPELLADMARTVDHISGGRLIFGIGSGWFRRDYDEYGYDFGTAGSRLRELRGALPRIRERMARLNPPPMGPMPILIGGAGEQVTLRIVAEHADIWHSFARDDTGARTPVEQFRHKSAVLARWCEERGRDPATIERSVGLDASQVDLGPALADAGADEFLIAIQGPDFDLGQIGEWLAFRDEYNRNAA